MTNVLDNLKLTEESTEEQRVKRICVRLLRILMGNSEGRSRIEKWTDGIF